MPTRLNVGDRCDGYEMIRYLGSGRSSEVWAARAPSGGVCAFKMMSATGAEKARARFVQEGEALARIVHPSVVRVLGAGAWEDRVWLALELIEGETLRQRLHRGPGASRPALDDVLDWIQQVCEGLAQAHVCEVVHRGLGLDSIVITGDERARLLGFGMAKLRAFGLKTTEDQQIGSAKNLAPEVSRGATASAAMDIYALGHVLYEALSGAHAMGDTPRPLIKVIAWHLCEEAQPLREVAPAVPPGLAILVHEMLEKEPAKRPASVRAVIERLQGVRTELRAEVFRAVRSVPRAAVVPAMGATMPMAACDVTASPSAKASATVVSAAGATSVPGTTGAPSKPITTTVVMASVPMTTAPRESALGSAGWAPGSAAAALGHVGGDPQTPAGAAAADRVAMLPVAMGEPPKPQAAGTTLISATAPNVDGRVSRVPEPSLVPPAPADLRTTDAPVEGAARRSSVTPRRASLATLLVLAGGATLAAGWLVVARVGGPAPEASATARPAAPPPAPAPTATTSASASASATATASAASAKAPVRRPPKVEPRAPVQKPAKNRVFGADR